jgi:GxxExxY protein
LAENEITEKIIGAAIEVHRHLGPGLLESVSEECLCYELSQLGLRFRRQAHLPIKYKGIKLESAYKMDLVVEEAIVVEIKATEETPSIYSAQLLTYLKAAGLRVGLLINFNVAILKKGLKRVVNHYAGGALGPRSSAPSAFELGEPCDSPDLRHSQLCSSPRLRASASKTAPDETTVHGASASKTAPDATAEPALERRPS